jgi:hypothetical protein
MNAIGDIIIMFAFDGVPIWCWLPALISTGVLVAIVWRSGPTWRELIRRHPLDPE